MRRFTSVLMLFSLLLMAGGLMGVAVSALPVWVTETSAQSEPPVRTLVLQTPFKPEDPTPTSAPKVTLEPDGPGMVVEPAPTDLPTALPDSHFAGRLLDFPQEKIQLRFEPGEKVNGGQAIRLAFVPGQVCDFGVGRACVSRHRSGQVILLTIHSGLGGEGDRLRNVIEGTGLDSAGLTMAQIHANMAALNGAAVRLTLGDALVDGLELAALARVPSMDVKRYFDLSFDDALQMVAVENAPIQALLDSREPLLAFEICGWRVASEVSGLGTTPTTSSIYLGLIRLRSQPAP